MRLEDLPDETVKRELCRRLGRKVKLQIWKYLVEKGWAGKLRARGATYDNLVEEYNYIEKDYHNKVLARKQRPPKRRASLSDERLRVQSLQVARVAAKRPEVKRFRERHGGILTIGDVYRWSAIYLRREVRERNQEMQRLLNDLEYVRRQHGRGYAFLAERVDALLASVLRGYLDELHEITDLLASVYGWPLAAAEWFILTDQPYFYPPAQVSYRTLNGATTQDPKDVQRIVLELSPNLQADQVADLYRDEVRRLRVRRYRTPKRSPSVLVAFVDKHKHLRWKDRCQEWNRTMPSNWHFREPGNMMLAYQRVCRRAGLDSTSAIPEGRADAQRVSPEPPHRLMLVPGLARIEDGSSGTIWSKLETYWRGLLESKTA